MTTSTRRRAPSSAPNTPTPQPSVCFSIVLQFPCPAPGVISRDDIGDAIRRLGYIPRGEGIAITIVAGSLADLITCGVERELRERDERRRLAMLPPSYRAKKEAAARLTPVGEAVNG